MLLFLNISCGALQHLFDFQFDIALVTLFFLFCRYEFCHLLLLVQGVFFHNFLGGVWGRGGERNILG